MGCFSFICKECGDPILSNSASGQEVKLFLLDGGDIIQEIEGQYDSYGRVFAPDLKSSIHWRKDWSGVCDLMHGGEDGSGIAAIHSKCFKGLVPTTASDDDPEQGWGTADDYDPDEEEDDAYL